MKKDGLHKKSKRVVELTNFLLEFDLEQLW